MPTLTDSRITAVTVFLDRAKITRCASVTIPAGQSTVVIANLPTTIYPESVRAKGRGAGVRILGLDVPIEHHARTPDANAADLQANLESLENSQRELSDQSAIEEQRVKMAGTLRTTGATDLVKGLAWGRSGIESIDALSKYAAAEETAAKAAIREFAQRQKTLGKEIEALKARLRLVQQPASTTRRAIHVNVEADAADTLLELEVTYACAGATWNPLYDARLQDESVHVTYLGMITQSTGEDWTDVELALSTARSAVTTEIPELSPWYLDAYVPPVVQEHEIRRRMSRSAPAAGGGEDFDAVAMTMMAPVQAPAPAPPAEELQATADHQGASVTFRLPRRTGIPSDNTPHRAQIATLELPAKLDYITAPSQAEQAYLRAKVENNSGYVLLPGKANLFHGEEYVGVTMIEDTAAREFELQMGVDERVSVTRELVHREVSKAFIGSTKKTQFSYRIRIANQLAAASRITILDRIPHSRHEDIKVKLLDTAPKVTEQTDLSELKWNLTLEAGRTMDVQFGFSVEHPKVMRVLGIEE